MSGCVLERVMHGCGVYAVRLVRDVCVCRAERE